MIPIAIIIPLVALTALPLLVLFLFFHTHYIQKNMGSREEFFPHTFRFQFIGIIITSPILIALNFIREFDLLVRVAICGVGLMGFYIGMHDMLFSRIGGIYKNGLVWNGNYVFYSDITKFERLDSCVLEITLHDGRTKDYFSTDKTFVDKVCFTIEREMH